MKLPTEKSDDDVTKHKYNKKYNRRKIYDKQDAKTMK